MEYLELGSSPANEDCVQVGSLAYNELARAECNRYRDQLNIQFSSEVEAGLIKFVIKSFPHDFGNYFEVCVIYDEKNEESVQAAFSVEDSAWTEWM